MKRFVLVAVMLVTAFVAKAQFHPYYSPYEYADATLRAIDDYKLGHIAFDEGAIKDNPDAWERYMNYLGVKSELSKRYRTYSTVCWTGVGITCASMIPFMVAGGDRFEAFTVSEIIGGIGGIAALVGALGMATQSNRIKFAKKEMIYYLRASNNGIGIVTLF